MNTDPFVGQRIEKCRVLKPLSRGGYGTTYLAFDEELQAHRVLKVSHDLIGTDAVAERQLKAFLEEGLILSRLKHPQIVTLRAQGEYHGRRYMVLDFVEGYSLRETLESLKNEQGKTGLTWPSLLDPLTATAIIASTLEPLAYAHEAKVRLPGREVNGVAHRDIAPGNLILGQHGDEQGKVVLIDFGTAKTDLAEMVTLNQSLIGTLPYMSKPRLQRAQSQEQALAQQAFWSDYSETRNDIHALGVLYAQLLLGQLPFRGEMAPEILVNILDQRNYHKLYQEVEKAFPQALSLIERMVVWFDVNLPLNEQGRQFRDAAELRPLFQEFYQSLSPKITPHERVLRLNKTIKALRPVAETTVLKQGIPEGSSRAKVTSVTPLEFRPKSSALAAETKAQGGGDVQETPPPYAPRTVRLEISRPKSKVGIGWILLPTAMLILVALFLWLNVRGKDSENRKSIRFAALERIEPQSADSQAQESNPMDRQKPATKSAKSTPGSSNKNSAKAIQNLSDSLRIELAQKSGTQMGLTLEQAREPLTLELLTSLQNRIRARDTSVFSELSLRLQGNPKSVDLRYLRMRWVMEQEAAQAKFRSELAGLYKQSPHLVDRRVFAENALFWAWRLNFKLFQAEPSEENRIALIQASHQYLAAYAENPLYGEKVQAVRSYLPQ